MECVVTPRRVAIKTQHRANLPNHCLSSVVEGAGVLPRQTKLVWPHWLTLPVLARLWAELYRLETETGIARDIQLESTDLGTILLWVHVEPSEWPDHSVPHLPHP